MEHLLTIFEQFGFTKTEGLVYLDLLQNDQLTGYQIAKNIGLSRSSVYNALNALYRRGVVFLLPGENNLFRALEPAILIPRLRREYDEASKALEEGLSHLEVPNHGGRFYNLEGYENVITKAKEVLISATKEVLINTDFSPAIFETEFEALEKKGIRVIMFTFNALGTTPTGVELYSHSRDVSGEFPSTRLMITSDCGQTLIASLEGQRKYVGTFTENSLFSSVISEHIHHDIYLLKLKQQNASWQVEGDILLGSNFESCHIK